MCIKLYSHRLWWTQEMIQFISLRTFILYYIGSNKISTWYHYTAYIDTVKPRTTFDYYLYTYVLNRYYTVWSFNILLYTLLNLTYRYSENIWNVCIVCCVMKVNYIIGINCILYVGTICKPILPTILVYIFFINFIVWLKYIPVTYYASSLIEYFCL